MKETVLKSLMRLFAIVSQLHSIGEKDTTRSIVEHYLKIIVKSGKISHFLIMFDFYHNSLRERELKTGEKQLSLLSVKSVIICDQIDKWLDKKNRLLVIVHILEIISRTNKHDIREIDFVHTIASALKIDETNFNDCKAFIFENIENIKSKNNVLIVNSGKPLAKYRYLYKEFLKGSITIIYFEEVEICLFKKNGIEDQLYFNEELIEDRRTYFFETGTVIKSPLMGTLFYTDAIRIFLHDDSETKLNFIVDNLSYRFADNVQAVAPFSLSEAEGQLVGIMGDSGVGKSTLINLLNGTLEPTTGRVLLNGYDIHKEKKTIEGLIGYVPQDDVLIEELTVYQNLYFNAKLCFSDISEDRIIRWASRMLYTLGLYEIKDLKVGSILSKTVSGGQRKRLNIALELIREPHVLFVDEPTSGLSSNDSNLVIDLLKKQSYKGKLVFINIHQPSSETFRKLDKLIVMDKGGKIIFHGNPIDSITYLKIYSQLVNAEEGECPRCGNLNTDQVLSIIESKKINDFGDYTDDRLIYPDEWYSNFRKNQNSDFILAGEIKSDLPKIHFHPPKPFAQFRLFGLRNLLTRLADKQYLFLNIIESPALAFILGWFTRYNAGTDSDPSAYIFSKNINIPAFLFISVLVSLFLGFMVSAVEIIRDRKLIKRETYLNLSQRAFYNSKVLYLAVVLAFQIFLYVLVANTILEIKGMFFQNWLLLWVTSLVACLLGLNLSASMNTVVAIYIVIPLLLIPQILLGGAIIKFDKLNAKITNPDYVPVVGDIMPSRWAYEALVVNQFANNRYEKELFQADRNVSNASFMLNYYIPELKDILTFIRKNISQNYQPEYFVKQKIDLLLSELKKLKLKVPMCQRKLKDLNDNVFNISTSSNIEQYLECCRSYYILQLDKLITERDKEIDRIKKLHGGHEGFITFRNEYYNDNLADIVLSKNEPVKLEIKNDHIICKADPVFYLSNMSFGRSHFYAAEKHLGNFYIETYWFNLFVLFLIGFVCYLLLIYNVFIKIHTQFNKRTLNYLYTKAISSVKLVLHPLLNKKERA